MGHKHAVVTRDLQR